MKRAPGKRVKVIVVSAVSFSVAVAACGAGDRATVQAPSNSESVADSGTDAPSDTSVESITDSAMADQMETAAINISVPIGACLPRKTEAIPVVKVGPTRVGFPVDIVQNFVRKGARAAVDDCVRAAREREPNVAGKIVMHFELPTTGGIKDAAVSRGVGDRALHECVKKAFDQAPMPVLRDGGKTIIDNFSVVVCPDGHTEWPAD